MTSIAVIIPAFNSTKYLGDTLRSISRQQRKPDEVLVVDDGSTDGTAQLVESWASTESFEVRVLKNRFKAGPNEPRGPAGGRMTGLLEARADLVALLDHDDEFLPNHLHLTERAFRDHPQLELCFGDATEFDAAIGPGKSVLEGKQIHKLAYKQEAEGLRMFNESAVRSISLEGSYIPTAANLWRRETAIRIGGFEVLAGTCDDLHFFLRLLKQGDAAYYPFPIARKRKHERNLSNPRHALDLVWHAYDALGMVVAEAARWNFTRAEKETMETRMAELAQEILYHASRQGIGMYWSARRRLGVADQHRVSKSIARALVSSTRMMLGSELNQTEEGRNRS